MKFSDFETYLEPWQIRHFKAEELWRHNPPMELWPNIIPTILVLDDVREHFDVAIYPTSTYRDEKYNKKVGGRTDSLHTHFNAIDFVIKDKEVMTDVWKYLCSKTWSVSGPDRIITSALMGIGIYDTFVHIDTRAVIGKKAPARWDERKSK